MIHTKFPNGGNTPANLRNGTRYTPMKERAAQMGLKHTTKTLKKPTDIDYTAFAHTTRIGNTYQLWSKEAHEANQIKLPTVHVLVYIQNIPVTEFEPIPYIQAT